MELILGYIAGVLTLINPCVLPVLPIVLASGLQAGRHGPIAIAAETVLVDFAADWCSTCKRQERIICELREADPLLDENITFIRVDWDLYGSDDVVAASRNVPRRSTLLLLKGDEELGRIVAGTGTDEIKALLALGLQA